MLFQHPRRLDRFGQVARTLTRHGFGAALAHAGAGRRFSIRQRFFRRPEHATRQDEAKHLRQAFEELGVTFVKLGQVLSTRPDLLPAEYIEELAKLRDAVPPSDAAAIRETIESELGEPIHQRFAEFDDTSLASASIGQVHAASLLDGTPVVVKVQKPGLLDQITTDLGVLRQLAETAERRSQAARRYGATALVDEFEWQLRAELDYLREARNARRLADQVRENPAVVVPAVYREHTTRRVLTMERLDGISIDDTGALDAGGFDRHALADAYARLLLDSIFEHGFYHADPHPGNFLVQPDGAIAVLDFGMVAQISDDARLALVRLLDATIRQEAEAVVDALAELDMRPRPDARTAFLRDMQHVLDAYYGLDLGDFSAARLYQDLTTVSRRHSIPLPSSLALLFKTITMNEGVVRKLDPGFNVIRTAEPFAREALADLRSPFAVARRAARSTAESALVAPEVPAHAWRLLQQAERGEFEIRIRPDEIDRAIDGLRAIINRLAAAIIGAAVTVAVPIVLLANRPPAWRLASGVFLASGPIIVGTLWSWALLSARRRE